MVRERVWNRRENGSRKTKTGERREGEEGKQVMENRS